ncbi:MAG: hydrogenase maturation protease [Caldilineaceae bacterium]|nr:hydrogenase maturation protease [Caldilineaceae bacterium]
MITPHRDPSSAPDPVHPTGPRRIIVGIGHDYRRDDAVGLVVARALAAHHDAGLEVCCLGEDLLRLLEFMQPGAHIVIVDAVISGAPAGTLHHRDLLREPGGDDQSMGSSHLFGLGQVLALASALGRTPAALHLIGVEAMDVSTGQGFSDPVAASANALIVSLAEKSDFCEKSDFFSPRAISRSAARRRDRAT